MKVETENPLYLFSDLKNTEIAELLGDYHPSEIGEIFKTISCPERKKDIESVERAYKQQIQFYFLLSRPSTIISFPFTMFILKEIEK